MNLTAVEPAVPLQAPSLVPAFAAQVPAVGWTSDRALRITSTHGAFISAFALDPQRFVGRNVYELFGGDRAAAAVAAHVAALNGERSSFPHVWRGRDFDAFIEPLRDDGAIVGCVGLAIDVTDVRRAERWVSAQARLVEMVARDEPLEETLAQLAAAVDQLGEDLCCAILRRDRNTLVHAAAPRLSHEYRTAFEELVLGDGGPFAAALAGETLVVADIAGDSRWAAVAADARQAQVGAVWAAPIASQNDTVVGVCAVYSRGARVPGAADLQLLGTAAHVAAVALDRDTARRALVASEERARLLFEEAHDLISTANLDGNLTSVNRAYVTALGYQRDELLGMNVTELLTEESLERALEHFERKQQGDAATTYEADMRRRDGTLLPVEISSQLIYEGGLAVGTKAFCRDITARREAQRALEASEERYALAIAGTSDGLWDWDLRTDEVYFSPRWKEMLGYGDDELANHFDTWTSLLHPDDREPALATVKGYLSGSGLEYALEHRLRHKDGSYRWILARGKALRDDHGERYRMLGSHVDFTERHHAQEELEQLYRQQSSILDAAGEAIIACDEEQRIAVANPAAAAMCGYTAEEMIGQVFHTLLHHSRPDGTPYSHEECEILALVHAGGGHGEDVFWRKDGTSFSVRYTASRVADKSRGAGAGAVYVFEDITDRQAAAAQVAMHRDIVSHMDVGLYVYQLEDPADATSLRLVEANAGSERATGVEAASVIGKRLLAAFPALAETELPQIYGQVARGAPTHDFGDVAYNDDKINEQTFAVRAFPLPGLKVGISFANVTAQRKLEAQLRQSQKMEAVGRLAGGVAHDFNNLLLAISGYANFALDRLNGGDPTLRSDMEEISKASARAATLTSQLLAFSRQQVLEPKPVNLNDSVADIEKMLGRLLGEDIAIVTMPDPALAHVMADRSQIDQVVLNLAVNARDAMPDGGTLTLETANVHLDEHAAAALCGADPGRYVVLSVSDTGEGMDEATRVQAFEPFFTTKPQGAGTGLGLATVYGIVKQSGGYVTIESAPGFGATFTIYLRRIDEAVDAVAVPITGSPLPGSETLLLVEDEDVVRDVVTLMLEQHGYDVVAVSGPNEALERYRDGARFDLVVTDVVMPEMNGPELVRRLLEQCPQLKVVYASGYTNHAVLESGTLTSANAFLQKPFSAAELASKVRDVLDAACLAV